MAPLVPQDEIDAAAAAIVDAHIKRLIERIERAVDEHQSLTRLHARTKHRERAELVFSGEGWDARVKIRSHAGWGVGARHMVTARTRESHSSPSSAADELIKSLEVWGAVLSKP